MTTPVQLLRNLIVMALVDKRLNESEVELLKEYARLWNVDETTVAQLIKETLEGSSSLEVPMDKNEGLRLLEQMLRMMAADGKLAQREKELFAQVAVLMNLSIDEINALIDRTVEKHQPE
ncbi:MAG: hypothetical protein KatS3mg110_3967 [Pirellulaceae bacterium]|nr:MAG: hypothetical protein KatS3mg110_3967 [Pirellulaceae bacterium]